MKVMRMYTYSKTVRDVVHNPGGAGGTRGLLVLTQAYPSIIVGT
jgi:hypothetical protein